MTRDLVRAVGIALALNVAFLAVAIAVTFLPRTFIIARVRQAFTSGELGVIDYRFFDSRRGFHQFNDCAVLQMVTNATGHHLADAVGPPHYLNDEKGREQCLALLGLINGRSSSNLIATRHARYWHGYNVVASILLTLMPLSAARAVLKIVVYCLVLALPIAARRERRLLRTMLAISAAFLFFYAMPYFEQSLTHAPGDICIFAGLVWVLTRGRNATGIEFGAIFGALFAYFDDLIGVIPIGTALSVTVSYLVSIAEGSSRAAAWRRVLDVVVGLAVGGVFTIASKQALSFAVLGPSSLGDFAQHLTFYVSPVYDAVLRVPRPLATILLSAPVLLPFAMLVRTTTLLTYGSTTTAVLLLGVAGIAWVVAAGFAWRRGLRSDFLAFLAGCGVIAGWILAAQTHTYYHAVFMVRLETIPIALGWGALVWLIESDRMDGGG